MEVTLFVAGLAVALFVAYFFGMLKSAHIRNHTQYVCDCGKKYISMASLRKHHKFRGHQTSSGATVVALEAVNSVETAPQPSESLTESSGECTASEFNRTPPSKRLCLSRMMTFEDFFFFGGGGAGAGGGGAGAGAGDEPNAGDGDDLDNGAGGDGVLEPTLSEFHSVGLIQRTAASAPLPVEPHNGTGPDAVETAVRDITLLHELASQEDPAGTGADAAAAPTRKANQYVTVTPSNLGLPGAPFLIHVLVLLSRLNGWPDALLSRDRLLKILQAGCAKFSSRLTRDIGTTGSRWSAESGESQSLMQEREISLGCHVAVSFWDAAAPGGARFWIGYVTNMISRRKGMTAVRWFNPVKLSDIPGDLFLICEWLEPAPSAPEENIHTTRFFNRASTPAVISDTFTEVEARHVIAICTLTQPALPAVAHLQLDHAEHVHIQHYLQSHVAPSAQAAIRPAPRAVVAAVPAPTGPPLAVVVTRSGRRATRLA